MDQRAIERSIDRTNLPVTVLQERNLEETLPTPMQMNPSAISALAALTGAAIGGLTSIIASLLAQKYQARAQWIVQERLRRQELYRAFIEGASKCHIDALQHCEADIPDLVQLYATIGRMHIVSSPKVVENADLVARKILDVYLEPNKTFFELRQMVNSGAIHILDDFTEACRGELEGLRAGD